MNNLLDSRVDATVQQNKILNDPTYGPAYKKMRKEMAKWQTQTADPMRRQISNIKLTAGQGQAGVWVSWNSDLVTVSEVEYGEVRMGKAVGGAISGAVNDFNYTQTHRLYLPNLPASKAFKLDIYSIGGFGNGGYKQITFTTPASFAGQTIPFTE